MGIVVLCFYASMETHSDKISDKYNGNMNQTTSITVSLIFLFIREVSHFTKAHTSL